MVKRFKGFRGRMRERLLVRTFRAAKKIPAPLPHPCPNYSSPYVNRIEAIWGSYFHITQCHRSLVITIPKQTRPSGPRTGTRLNSQAPGTDNADFQNDASGLRFRGFRGCVREASMSFLRRKRILGSTVTSMPKLYFPLRT